MYQLLQQVKHIQFLIWVQMGHLYLSGSSSTSYSTDLLPSTNNTYDIIGSSLYKWKDLYLAGIGYLMTLNNGSNLTIPTSGSNLISDTASQILTNKTISAPTMSRNWLPSGTQ